MSLFGAVASHYVDSAASYTSVVDSIGSVEGDYLLDESSGATAAARIGSAGSYGGTVTYNVAALVNDGGTAITVDGNTGDVSVPLSGLGTAGAFVAWVKSTDAVMIRDHVTTAAGWMLATNGTGVAARANQSASQGTGFSSSSVNDGSRHMVVLTTDGTTVTVYLDGSAGTPFTQSAAFSTMHTPLHFGRSGANTGTSNFFAGTYDRLTIFNKNLTAQNVTDLWNAGK